MPVYIIAVNFKSRMSCKYLFSVVRPTTEKLSPPATNESLAQPQPLVVPARREEEYPEKSCNRRVRHISLSNPLVKCRLTDKLQVP